MSRALNGLVTPNCSWWKQLSTPQEAYREQQAIEEIATERLADLMIQHGLSKHPDAQKWKEVEAEVIAVEPAIKEIDSTRIGPAWRYAKSKFSELRATLGKKVPTVEAEEIREGDARVTGRDRGVVISSPGQPNTPHAVMFSVDLGGLLSKLLDAGSKGPDALRYLLDNKSKLPAGDVKLLDDLSKDPDDLQKLLDEHRKNGDKGSRNIVRESKQAAKRSKEAAKTVKTYLKELLNGANSYLQIDDAIANYAGAEAKNVFKGVTGTILEMQSHCMPASLIKMGLKLRYGEQFEELVGAIWVNY